MIISVGIKPGWLMLRIKLEPAIILAKLFYRGTFLQHGLQFGNNIIGYIEELKTNVINSLRAWRQRTDPDNLYYSVQ